MGRVDEEEEEGEEEGGREGGRKGGREGGREDVLMSLSTRTPSSFMLVPLGVSTVPIAWA